MTNEQKYTTAEERVRAFLAQREVSSIATVIANEFANWLSFPVEEEKPEPCPFCGGKYLSVTINGSSLWRVSCETCLYESLHSASRGIAITAHNRVCRAVKKGEAK